MLRFSLSTGSSQNLPEFFPSKKWGFWDTGEAQTGFDDTQFWAKQWTDGPMFGRFCVFFFAMPVLEVYPRIFQKFGIADIQKIGCYCGYVFLHLIPNLNFRMVYSKPKKDRKKVIHIISYHYMLMGFYSHFFLGGALKRRGFLKRIPWRPREAKVASGTNNINMGNEAFTSCTQMNLWQPDLLEKNRF